MGLIRDNKGANISVAQINGYTKENVIKAKRYLKEIGNDRRNFPIERLVEMYNEVKGTKEKAIGCKPCQATKYFNGLQNYAYFGELTLINNNKCTKDDLDLDKIDAKEVETEVAEEPEVEEPREDIKERMAKVRAAKKAKKEEKND
jgi:hypothetical protein